MKIIPYIYYILAGLSFIGSFILMANSTEKLYFFSMGMVSMLVLSSVGDLARVIIKTAEITKNTEQQIANHTEALKYLTQRKRSK